MNNDSLFPKSKAQVNREKYAAAAQARETLQSSKRTIARKRRESQSPRFGSQEWAETRGDDLGASPDC